MAFLALLVALGAVVWAFKNSLVVHELEDDQRLLRKELARLSKDLSARPLAAPPPEAEPAAPTPAPPLQQPKPQPATWKPPVFAEPTPPPAEVVLPPRQAATPKPAFDWEALVGVRLFSWIAGIALVLAAIFFLKYSVDQHWLGPPMRMAIALITAIAILLFCELKIARRYTVTANALDGAGIAILFATFFAAHSIWNLLGALPTFGMMALVTVVAVLLSLHHDSVFVALLGLVGGFATPALLSMGEDRPIGLFTYLLVLNAGLAWVAYRKRWPYLTVASSVFTTLYQWGWAIRFMQPGTIPLALTIFTIFPVLTRVAVTYGERKGDERSPLFEQTASISAFLPLLFVIYMASVPTYGARYWLLFGFLFLLNVGLTFLAAKRGTEVLHLAGGLGTVVTLWAWLQRAYTSEAWPAVLVVVAGFVLFYVAVAYWVRFNEVGTRGLLAAPLLLIAFPVLTNVEPAAANPATLFGVLFVLIAAIAACTIARGDSTAHILGAVFTLAAEAVWSVKHLDGAHLYSGLLIYTIFGLFYVAVSIGVARAGQWDRYLALSGYVFLFFVVFSAGLSVPPWPFLVVLAVLDLAIAATSLYTRRGELLVGAMVASQILLIGWQSAVRIAPWPSVSVVAGLVVACLGVVCFLIGNRMKMTVESTAGTRLAVACVMASALGAVNIWIAVAQSTSLATGLLAAVLGGFAVIVLLVDKVSEWSALAPISVFFAASIVFAWSLGHAASLHWSHELLFAAAIHVLYLAYPMLRGSSLKRSIGPHLAAVLSSAAFFISARHSLMAAGFENVIGILPVVQAGLMGILLWRLLKIEPRGERAMGRLAMVAGAALAFVTVALPLQLEKQWITIGWALLAAALAWLYLKIPHNGLLAWTFGLLVAVFARLALNPAVLDYHPRSGAPLLNWYLYTYLVAAAAFFAVAWLLRGRERIVDGWPSITSIASSLGLVLLFLLLNIEIADYYSVGENLTFNFSAGLAQDLTYTIGWGLFSFAMLIAGLLLANKPGRVAAILLLSVTVAKCFLHDLWRLGGLYRVGSFVGLAVCLTLVALLLQKFVLKAASPLPRQQE